MLDGRRSLFAGAVLFAVLLGLAGLVWGEDALAAPLAAGFGVVLAVVLHRVAGFLVADGRFTGGEAWGYGFFCLLVSIGLYFSFWPDEARWWRILVLAAGQWAATLAMVSLRLQLDRRR